MKKIDILNFITNFRKAPNDIKTHHEILNHLGATNASAINAMLLELQQGKVIRETERNGEKAYQVIAR
jgi:SOS-response transcriptional repressor LexA